MAEQKTTRTTCPYCGVGCGVLVERQNERVAVRGDTEHPANYGRLCSKGTALAETLSLKSRLLYPEIQGQRATWEKALQQVAAGFQQTIDRYGPDAVAFYVSGQLLTEDYYVANKLMKGFIGSANIDTNSRLCMSSTTAGYKRAFGADIVPGCYEDLDQADLIILVGSNTAWCHPVLFQRIRQAKKDNRQLKIVSIDPRRTATDEIVDLHLSIQPGTDVILFNGLLNFLRQNDRLDFTFLESHVSGFSAALAAALTTAPSIPAVAGACGISEEDVANFYHWFARTEKVVTAWSQGVNQSSSGTDKVNSIINVHLATGRIGKPGMGPFSLTGQPNAMGGREVGGMANQLAAHMELENPEHHRLLSEFWHTDRLAAKPGLTAVELFQVIGRGDIKAVWIMGTNPAVSLPDAESVRAALGRCELVVVSDCERNTDLMPLAHIRLPALTWGEKDGTVTNSERRISRQRPFLPAPGEARPDWWIITQVARLLDFGKAFPYRSAFEIFQEHARLSGFANEGRRAFDISGLAGLDRAAYDALQPVQWPVRIGNSTGSRRLGERFWFADRRARMHPLKPKPPAFATDDEFPLVLNSGRIRDHWHTMTRTAKSPRLTHHITEPFAELHPLDAACYGIKKDSLVLIASRYGEALARAKISRDQRPGSIFIPMHWNDQYAHNALVNALVNPATDPFSGEPESKHTPVNIRPFQPAWYGFVLARHPLPSIDTAYAVKVKGNGYWLYELADLSTPDDWPAWARSVTEKSGMGDWIDYLDASAKRYRGALLREGKLHCCVFVSPDCQLPPRSWLEGLFNLDEVPVKDRLSLLAGRPSSPENDPGQIVCACFGVGVNKLLRTIQEQSLTSVQQVGEILKAGTNCGSCVPELKALLSKAGRQAA